MGATADVARYVAEGRLEDVPESVRDFAKLLFVDTLGVAVAGTQLPAARIATAYAERLGAAGGDAHVLGASHRWAPAVAAFANGVSAHTLDYDDTSFLTIAHASGSAVPALLAVAEETGASGRDVLEAFVYAHEGMARLSLAIMPTHYLLGWHTTGTLSTLSAALAAAKVMGFDADQTAQTLGVASSMAGGMRANFGTFTKALHTGMAAFHGVLSAGLVRDGFTGNPDILEHRYGFWPLMAGADNVRPELTEAAARDRSRFYLDDPSVGIKLHPCNSAVLAGIGTALRLTIEHDVQPEAVERVDYGYMHVARGIVPFDDPRNSPEAQYSMTHAIAASIVRRRAGIPEFSEEGVHDPAIAAMRKKVHPYEHPDLRSLTDPHDVPACEVTIHFANGAKVSGSLRRPKAYPGGEPVTKAEVLAKFTENVDLVLPGRAEQAVALVDALEAQPGVGELVEGLSR